MKQFSIFLIGLLFYVLPAKSQNYTWIDSYTYTTPVCSPFVVNSSMSINIPVSLTHQSLTINVPGSPNFQINFPLTKQYRFDVYRTSGGVTTLVGSITKTTLALSMPVDFQTLLSSMTPGFYEIYVTVELNWPFNTPYTLNYSGRINGPQVYQKGDLEAPGNSTFSWSAGKVACFNFTNCFSGSLSSYQKFGIHKVTANVTGGSGSYRYEWLVEVNKFNPGGNKCLPGTIVYSATTTTNQISVPCTPCNYIVWCRITDLVTGCRFTYTKTLSACEEIIQQDTVRGGGDNMKTLTTAPGSNIRILPVSGRQLQIDGLTPGTNKKLSIYNLEGIVLQQAFTGTGTQVRLPLYGIKKSGNYVVAIEQSGVIIARSLVRIE